MFCSRRREKNPACRRRLLGGEWRTAAHGLADRRCRAILRDPLLDPRRRPAAPAPAAHVAPPHGHCNFICVRVVSPWSTLSPRSRSPPGINRSSSGPWNRRLPGHGTKHALALCVAYPLPLVAIMRPRIGIQAVHLLARRLGGQRRPIHGRHRRDHRLRASVRRTPSPKTKRRREGGKRIEGSADKTESKERRMNRVGERRSS